MTFRLLFSVLLMSIVLCFSSASKSEKDTTDDFKFYMAKSAIRQNLIETTNEVGFSGTEFDFGSSLEKKLEKVKYQYPEIDYTVLTSMQDTAKIIIALIGFEGEKGFIGWKFDTIIVDGAAYFFSVTLPDRSVPELKPEDYHQWYRMKKK